MSREQRDVVVIGGGPGGAMASSFLAQAGRSVLLLERTPFPRYHIGESLTGIAGKFIDELGLSDVMNGMEFPPKVGVTVIGTDSHNEFFVPVPFPTWQVRREDFDKILLDRAIGMGVEHRLGTAVGVLRDESGAVTGIQYTAAGEEEVREVDCKAVIDASGHSAFMSRQGLAGPRQVDAFGRQIAVFSQYRGAVRDPGVMANKTIIFYSKVHHWAWFIPISPDVVSIGVVMPIVTYKARGQTPQEVLDWGIANINPDLTWRVADAPQVHDVHTIQSYSYRIDPFVGNGWIAIGDAHRFTDPIFSFGVTAAMLEAKAAAEAIDEGIRTGSFAEPCARFAEYSNRGQDAIYDFLRYFWKFPAFFAIQTRGLQRRDFIHLFAGDFYNPAMQETLTGIRRNLYTLPAEAFPDPFARDLAERTLVRFVDFQGLDGIYLRQDDGLVKLVFVVERDAPEVHAAVADFRETLLGMLGQGRVALTILSSDDPEETLAAARQGATPLLSHKRPGARGVQTQEVAR
jgi:flavin-dependent dehydrogenase